MGILAELWEYIKKMKDVGGVSKRTRHLPPRDRPGRPCALVHGKQHTPAPGPLLPDSPPFLLTSLFAFPLTCSARSLLSLCSCHSLCLENSLPSGLDPFRQSDFCPDTTDQRSLHWPQYLKHPPLLSLAHWFIS